MNASKINDLKESNTFALDAPNKLELLRSAVIYGPNAAGKSNFLQAMREMGEIVVTSASSKQTGDAFDTEPFRLDSEMRNSPTEFEVVFIAGNIRFQYGFTVTKNKVLEEWLMAYPKGRTQRWFHRVWDDTNSAYHWDMGNALVGEKQVWQKATRDNALFLSTAVLLNSEQLKPIFDWFRLKLRFSNVNGWSYDFSADVCTSDKKNEILSFLKAADIDIDDISVKKDKFNPSDLPEEMPDYVKEMIVKNMKDEDVFEIKTLHKDNRGELISFNLGDESDGTRKVFSFAGPWMHSLKHGNILFIDELHDNLHPKLVGFLVALFHSKKTNPNNAQLVFTTHETSILTQNVFRRDQVWFCDKDENKATVIYPLTDFSPRKGREDLEAAYLSGRYGALPFIKKMEAI
ncbi:AAA family ATPase [Serratia fonticola]|uniref:AAA family ATPase n=1 Tax=Serratia fonticola TaxID=47917 RepID=UPI001F2FBAD2|nr:ATP-binding protein [Serratia fonticola]